MKNKTLELCQAVIHPGESVSLALPLPELFSCAPLFMPIKVVHGKKSGPCLLVTAAMHGNEVNGTEIISRLLDSPILKNLCGTLIAVPVINVYGVMTRSRFLPGNIDMDSCFPGMKTGNNASRMAHSFIENVFPLADVCIDLQTGWRNFSNLPQVFVDSQNEDALGLADSFGAAVISNLEFKPGRLCTYAKSQNIPFMMYEAGEAMRFDEHAINVGMRGLVNVMQHMEMIDSDAAEYVNDTQSFESDELLYVRAPGSGIAHSAYLLGEHIKKGDVLGIIKDPFGVNENIYVKSPEDAVIVGISNTPLVQEGEVLWQLAIFPRLKNASKHLKKWGETFNQQEG